MGEAGRGRRARGALSAAVKLALVTGATGATGGIGRAIAFELADAGFDVAATATKPGPALSALVPTVA